MKGIGAALRESRGYLGFSISDAADISKIDERMLADIEAELIEPDASHVKILASLYCLPEWNESSGFQGTRRAENVKAIARAASSSAFSDKDRDELVKFSIFLEGRVEQRGHSS